CRAGAGGRADLAERGPGPPARRGVRTRSAGERAHRFRPRRHAMTEAPAFLAEPALAAVMAALPEARVVGGAVRDALAGRPIADVDLATPRTPEQVSEGLA